MVNISLRHIEINEITYIEIVSQLITYIIAFRITIVRNNDDDKMVKYLNVYK